MDSISDAGREPTVSTLAGTGVGGFLDGPTAVAQLHEPFHVAADSAGIVYVADRNNHRIRVVANGMVSTLAGSGTPGHQDGPAATAMFNLPEGVAVDGAGNVYVGDTGNNQVRMISNGQVSTLAGDGTAGFADGPPGAARFSDPEGVEVDGSGTVYVADKLNCRVRKIDVGKTVSTIAGTGVCGFVDGPATTVAQLEHPYDVAWDPQGIYVADRDTHAVRVITGGTVSTLAGTNQLGYQDGPLSTAMFAGPRGIARDSAGNLYVADRDNHVIRRISGSMVTTFAGSGIAGYLDGPASSAQFVEPYGVAVDGSGRVYVADRSDDRVRVIVP